MIQEDGIVSGQKTVGGVLHNYVHNHVFRRTSNGPWGVLAYHSDINLDANTALNFQMSVPVESDWVLDNCNIVVVVSKESNREIIGLDEKAVTE